MKQYLHTTFGSQKVLQALQADHPERHMLLTIDDRDQTNFQLLEETNAATSVFANPISYDVLSAVGETDDIRGWIHFTFLTIPDEEMVAFQKQWTNYQTDAMANVSGLIGSQLLQRIDDNHQFGVMTTWTTRDYYTIWQADGRGPLQKYADFDNRYNLRTSSYSPAAFTKQKL
ncbi:hypothetical protein D3P96_04755 [Weissella viridescens]|uniref:ABM domain-containing protein n=1 Tax=Weissella viridescens TaxID=1629 RepID=A0A3P2RBM4_WEIVI|nr:antibiotic biosynthesis monooxygenase [Weissella viridescens]RRG17973.1 hypothetical protein D3P96_04755 [Weissella viridescens]